MIKWTLPTISPSTQRLIAAGVVLMLLFLSYDWILAPHCRYLQASQQKQKIDSDLQKKVSELEMKTRLYENKVGELKAFRRDAASRLFTQTEAEACFAGLASLAAESGCWVGAISFHSLPEPPETIELPEEYPSTLQFRGAMLRLFGPYESWVQIMEKIETTDKILFLNRFTLRSAEGSGQRLEGEIELVLPILLDIPQSLLIPPAPEEEDDDLEGDDDVED